MIRCTTRGEHLRPQTRPIHAARSHAVESPGTEVRGLAFVSRCNSLLGEGSYWGRAPGFPDSRFVDSSGVQSFAPISNYIRFIQYYYYYYYYYYYFYYYYYSNNNNDNTTNKHTTTTTNDNTNNNDNTTNKHTTTTTTTTTTTK